MVGIGASAGGLEALLLLLAETSATGCLTYVLAQHMAQDGHASLMVELLNRVSKLAVILAKPDERLLPDRVYLIPPGRDGVAINGHLRLQPPAAGALSTPSIDVLFNSIAENYGEHGVGVVLSGTGSDGTAGCRIIQAKGGVTFAQRPDTAIYSGMPAAAIKAGVVAYVAHESDLPREILTRLHISDRQPARLGLDEYATTNRALEKILQRVADVTHIDFSGYKEETLLRRQEKRQAMLKIASIEDYLLHVEKHPNELIQLQHAFLVSLSSFFRDRGAFDALQRPMRQMLDNKKAGDEIRVWVPGCASGEEVYSLAIMLFEMLGDQVRDYKISLLGTDLNAEAIAQAVSGYYQTKALQEIDPQVLERYFRPAGAGWQIKGFLQAICRFECGDVTRCDAMSGYDLISCRNLLIYLKGPVQGRLLQNFHKALKPDGLLFLGQSESLGMSGSLLFIPIDSYQRIFRKH